MDGSAVTVRCLFFLLLDFVHMRRGLGSVIGRAVSTPDPHQAGVVSTAAWAFGGPCGGHLGWTADLPCPAGNTSYYSFVEVRWGDMSRLRRHRGTRWSNILHLRRSHIDRLVWEGRERYWKHQPQRRSPHRLSC
ncbi:hypothetical protein NDU88_001567 [Pleurodeles waltl]|uniref:Secreted protein n=1 Tax=Pleurodeles waltl TaxID=8319 RepID=A0AAV7MLD2_PLEWA|nr:hypothetical protein NDU88_001567 [Pleurodeles waltl]